MKLPRSIALTGADKFILALESSGRAKTATENICTYRMTLDAAFDSDAFKRHVAQDSIFRYLSSLRLAGQSRNFNRWKAGKQSDPVVQEYASETDFQRAVSTESFDLFRTAPLRLAIIRDGEGCVLNLLWHHLLMDGQGATLLLAHLNGQKIRLSDPRTSSRLNWKNLRVAREAKRFIDRSARGKISSIEREIRTPGPAAQLTLALSAEMVVTLREKARLNQSKFGLGNYLLVLCARAIHRSFHAEEACTYWIPIPQDTRRKNAIGPLVGNQLSFLFFRLEMEASKSEQSLVAQLDAQMLGQIKKGIPGKYGHLLNFMRRFHPRVYHRLLTGPSGSTLTSFLYTYAPEHPPQLMEFRKARVLTAQNLPPNSYPPGLTFSIHTFGETMQICVQSYAHVLDAERKEKLEATLWDLLFQAE
jgi:hypothetical protein